MATAEITVAARIKHEPPCSPNTAAGIKRERSGALLPPPPPPPPSKKAKVKHEATAAAPVKGSFPPQVDASVAPHTLILGTQPSDNSLAQGRYYMTNTNAFWHIVGDALGFRRSFWTGTRAGAPPSIAPQLLHAPSTAVDYEEAMRRLTGSGYALWDILASSVRKGSLDSAIRSPVYADVRGLVRSQPSIRRICFATGKGSADLFRKGNKSWLAAPGAFELQPGDELSHAVFAKALTAGAPEVEQVEQAAEVWRRPPIQLVVLESVSPAYVPRPAWNSAAQRAAGYDDEYARSPVPSAYAWKRDRWLAQCFTDVPSAGATAGAGAGAGAGARAGAGAGAEPVAVFKGVER
jgi:G:T/U-mismatch repair DNA glycosylase